MDTKPPTFATGYADAWAGRPRASSSDSYARGYASGLDDKRRADTREKKRR